MFTITRRFNKPKRQAFRNSYQKQIPIVLEETAVHLGFEYILQLENSTSSRSGRIIDGVQASVNRANAEFPANRTGAFQDGVTAWKITNFIWAFGHKDADMNIALALNFGAGRLRRRKGIRNIAKEKKYRVGMYTRIRVRIF